MNEDLQRVISSMESDLSIVGTKPGEDRWSAIEVLFHLYTSESLSLKYLKKKTQAPVDQLKKSGWKTGFRKALLRMYLGSPFKFKAPKMVSLTNDKETPTFEALRDDYFVLRTKMEQFFDEMDPAMEDREIYRHPVAGRMNLGGMLSFMEKHMLRHEKQIDKTLRELKMNN